MGHAPSDLVLPEMLPCLPNSFSFCLDVRIDGLRRNVDAQAQPVGQSQCQSVLLELHAPLSVLAQCLSAWWLTEFSPLSASCREGLRQSPLNEAEVSSPALSIGLTTFIHLSDSH